MKFVLAKCPSCNGDLQVPDDKDFIICMYCGSTIKVRDAIKLQIDNNIPNLIQLIKEAYNNQNYPEAYSYCNRVLENELTNHKVWYYKGLVITKLPEGKNLRIKEIISCFQNALKNCPADILKDFSNELKETIYVISNNLYLTNINLLKNIDYGDDRINNYISNNFEIIELLKVIPKNLQLEENKLYELIISLCHRMIEKRFYNYQILVAGSNQIRTREIILDYNTKSEFNKIINWSKDRLRNLNPEKYAILDAEALERNKRVKKNGYIILGILGTIFIIAIIMTLYNPKKSDNKKNLSTTTTETIETIETTDYEKGMRFYNAQNYETAKEFFDKINENDSIYTSAQEYISKCKEKIKEEEQKQLDEQKKSKEEEKKAEVLEKKYKNIFDRNGWISEKQTKLSNMGFTEYNSGYEKAPDGSQQIAMYYKKYENGIYIHVRLQYSYSIEKHYVKVWVEHNQAIHQFNQ